MIDDYLIKFHWFYKMNYLLCFLIVKFYKDLLKDLLTKINDYDIYCCNLFRFIKYCEESY